MKLTAILRLSVYSAAAFIAMSVNATNIAQNQSELKAIQKEIDSLQKQIQRDEKILKNENSTLQDTEKDITALHDQLNQTQTDIEQARANQQAIKKQVDEERLRIDSELSKLANLVVSQHSVGEQGYLKLLLSQQDPASVERTLVYYKYLAKLSADSVVDSREQIKGLVVLEAKHTQQQAVLNTLLDQQKNQQAQLIDSQAKRKQAIATLDSELTKSANRIGRLQEDQRRIKKLVKGLQLAARKREEIRAKAAAKAAEQQRKAAEQKTAEVNNKTTTVIKPVIQRVSKDGLGKLQGRLKMPVKGQISAGFGTTKKGSGVKWNGLMLAVKQGVPVRSIYNGQIVYADWFKGFGQLVIVDHGKGYMSLYSHNSQITRSLGEQINANEVIAYTGSTGGLEKPGLYFEVRYNGEPRDPLLWVKR